MYWVTKLVNDANVNLVVFSAGLPNSMMADTISRHALAASMPTEPSNYVVPTMGLHSLPTLPHQLPLLPHVSLWQCKPRIQSHKGLLHWHSKWKG